LVRDPLRGREALERAVLACVLVERGDVQAGAVDDPAGHVADPDHSSAFLVQLGRGDTADVPEPLDDELEVAERPTEPRAGALDHHDDAGTRRLDAEYR